MNNREKIIDAVNHFWALSQESFESADRELEAGAYHTAINRIYYAAFYAATAALLERNLKYAKHSGVRAAFHNVFIQSGLLDKKWGKTYNLFFDDRQQGDYIALVHFDKNYIEERLSLCKEFLNAIKAQLTTLKEE